MNETAIPPDPGQEAIEQHPLPKSILLHLLPAVIWIAFYIPLARLASRKGVPTMLVMLVVSLFTLFAFELGLLYALGKKRNGRLSLRGIVLFREKIPWRHFVLLAAAIIAWQFLVLAGGWQINELMQRTFFGWIPNWFYLDRGAVGQNAPAIEIAMAVLSVLVFGIIGPVVEELYFRGFLLPRVSRFGAWAPVLNTALFLLYHFWQLHLFVISFVALLPQVYLVWRKRNVYLGIAVHGAENLIGNVIMGVIQRLG